MQTALRAVAAVVIAAVIGFFLARAGRGTGTTHSAQPALSRHAAGGAFGVDYPATWHRLPGPPSHLVPSLGAPVALSPNTPGQELIIGTAPAGASAARLPDSLQSAVDAAPHADLVQLGGRRFVRYLNLRPRGQGIAETLYLLPTTAGTLGAVCAAEAGSPSFVSDCERVLATLTPTAGSALSLGVDAGYALKLNRILAALSAARSSAGKGLQAGSLTSRAQAAEALATAHAAAATAIGGLTPAGSGLAALNRRLATVLEQTATQYRALGTAITQRRAGAYRTARAQLAASARALTGAEAQLSRFGYRLG